MIYETAEIDVTPGKEQLFEAAVAKAEPLFRASRGFVSIALHRVVEKPTTYRLFVGWETVDDHMVHFRNSEAFQEWRRLASPHFASPPRVDHVSICKLV
jgi:heme-degrading monooxygenase HmoA